MLIESPLCRLQEERERQAQLRGPPKIDPYNAATTIQKVHCSSNAHSLDSSLTCNVKYISSSLGICTIFDNDPSKLLYLDYPKILGSYQLTVDQSYAWH